MSFISLRNWTRLEAPKVSGKAVTLLGLLARLFSDHKDGAGGGAVFYPKRAASHSSSFALATFWPPIPLAAFEVLILLRTCEVAPKRALRGLFEAPPP